MAAIVKSLDRNLSMPLEAKLAPCGWRCPHRRPALMEPFGNCVHLMPVGRGQVETVAYVAGTVQAVTGLAGILSNSHNFHLHLPVLPVLHCIMCTTLHCLLFEHFALDGVYRSASLCC